RDPDVRLRIELLGVESRCEDADDDVGDVAERDTSTNHRAIVLKPSCPQGVTQDGHERTTRPIFRDREDATLEDRSTEETEELGGDARNRYELWFASFRQVDVFEAMRRHGLEDARLLPPDIERLRAGDRGRRSTGRRDESNERRGIRRLERP